ncbi:glycosyltransferase family 2 protein [Arthrobacter agilis]|uniref:glycosyltransferase family 2 protein n=1 Tax=Arthrobacter agilis TaxID=37921 RepID=UPI000B34BE20|nr:glycosyltransferase family 2 protein [Arthrobacter agilis]OUM44206.1 glycosyl transferase [Arthrobacter agilis]PPB46580.1 glycosyl transferase [Arthrobacter agilis]TPV23761.1 glycosyltransferase family 2 protein [Arthrobacter agilis]VDR32491.1 mycofactocin system glycosyltransferase [Arthrobacter agilis]
MTSRWSGEWALESPGDEPLIDVLIPSFGRPAELAVTLSGLAAQESVSFRVVVSDQTEGEPASFSQPAVRAMVRVLEAQGRSVQLERHLPRRGLAEHRNYLLSLARAPQVLFLDNDVWLEPGSLDRMSRALRTAHCGFVGSAVQGLSYLGDHRPHERTELELWPGNQVLPERIRPDTREFDRWPLHNAANLAHAAAELGVPPGGYQLYRVAWVGGCVLFDRLALVETGGFDFWDRLPPDHAGEDVAAQWRVMERYGGAGILPSGAVHLEAPTTVVNRDTDAAHVILGQ